LIGAGGVTSSSLLRLLLLGNFSSSLAVGWRPQFLTMWASLQNGIEADFFQSKIVRERKRERERERERE
jgi:hypothetical protein